MEYLLHIAILIGIYLILATGLNLIAGYAGLLSIAHAAFYRDRRIHGGIDGAEPA